METLKEEFDFLVKVKYLIGHIRNFQVPKERTKLVMIKQYHLITTIKIQII